MVAGREPGTIVPVDPPQPMEGSMKGIVAYALGVPVVVIALLYLTGIF